MKHAQLTNSNMSFLSRVLCSISNHLEREMAPHSSALAWKIPWTEEPGGLQSMGSLRVRHDWATSLATFHFQALEKEMATHSSVLAWRIPVTGEPDGLPSVGSHRVGHDWSDLAGAGAARKCDTKWERWERIAEGRQYWVHFVVVVLEKCLFIVWLMLLSFFLSSFFLPPSFLSFPSFLFPLPSFFLDKVQK